MEKKKSELQLEIEELENHLISQLQKSFGFFNGELNNILEKTIKEIKG